MELGPSSMSSQAPRAQSSAMPFMAAFQDECPRPPQRMKSPPRHRTNPMSSFVEGHRRHQRRGSRSQACSPSSAKSDLTMNHHFLGASPMPQPGFITRSISPD
eukprot:6033951-Pyramimonas_sp.AAC.1